MYKVQLVRLYSIEMQCNGWMDVWMDVHFGSWALTLSKECSLASYPSTESVDNASGRVIPAKKVFSSSSQPYTASCSPASFQRVNP